MSTVLHIDKLWKEYRLGVISHGTLAKDLQAWWARVRGKEDPNSRIGRPFWDKNRSRVDGDRFWALSDINLELKYGDVLGIIGKNGSGKSTLLKIISKVTAPTRGCISVKGRIASLLEVGTGFHPELTGRENIFLNAAIQGMSKREVKNKIDEIIEFSGVETFIDTPVKRYSSGMYIRLAFAVAAHLDAEILLVDEVLAVGDMEFQKKCLGKMEKISNEGRTLLFVSHNLTAVKTLCTRGIVLSDGIMGYSGSAEEAVEYYSESGTTGQTKWDWTEELEKPGNEFIALLSASICPASGDIVDTESGIVFECTFSNEHVNINFDVAIHVLTSENFILFESGTVIHKDKDSRKGEYRVKFTIPPDFLNSGHYIINMFFRQSERHLLLRIEDLFHFSIDESTALRGHDLRVLPGVLRPKLNWNYSFVE